jgi:hypothetical protein
MKNGCRRRDSGRLVSAEPLIPSFTGGRREKCDLPIVVFTDKASIRYSI